MLSRFSNIQRLGVLLFYRVKTNWINVIPLSVSQSDPWYLSMPLGGESSHSKYIQLWEFRVLPWQKYNAVSPYLKARSLPFLPKAQARLRQIYTSYEPKSWCFKLQIEFFQPRFARVINPSGKTRFCNLQYGPRNRGLWGIYLSLGSNRGGEFQFKGTFEFSRPCREIQQLSWPIITHLLTERCDNNS